MHLDELSRKYSELSQTLANQDYEIGQLEKRLDERRLERAKTQGKMELIESMAQEMTADNGTADLGPAEPRSSAVNSQQSQRMDAAEANMHALTPEGSRGAARERESKRQKRKAAAGGTAAAGGEQRLLAAGGRLLAKSQSSSGPTASSQQPAAKNNGVVIPDPEPEEAEA